MLRKGIVLAAVSVCGLVAFASQAKAQRAAENPYELTLGGTASHGPDLNGFNASVSASIGYYFTDTLEVRLVQSLTSSDIGLTGSGEGSSLNAATRLALDLHFPMGDQSQIVPYIGANVGYVYGNAVQDTAEAGPEAGLKIYVNPKTFIFVSVEYEFFFDTGSDASSAFSDGQFVYGLGIGFRF